MYTYIASKKSSGLVAAATFKIQRKWIVIVGEYFKQKLFYFNLQDQFQYFV